MSPLQRFAAGFANVPRGALLLVRTPSLWRVALVPGLLSVLLFAALVALSAVFGDDVLRLVWRTPGNGDAAPGTWLIVAYWCARLLAIAFLVALSAVVALLGSMVIAEPFVDVLSERTEQATGAMVPDRPFALSRACRDVSLAACEVGMDLSALVFGHAGLLLLHLVPLAGALAHFALGFLLSAFFAGLEVTAPALARREIRTRRRWSVLRADLARSVGLGAGVMLVLLVPLAQLLTLPIAVVAGTLTVLDWEREGRLGAGRDSSQGGRPARIRGR